jgi:nucleoside phosphorylase
MAQNTEKLSHDQYTVGWICALPLELSAAGVMLDKEHGFTQSLDRFDQNIYRLGEIGDHNVVIACLPTASGTASAATVATQMLRSFTSIKFGLMVGIGGGIPSTKVDIRLGDVVVSKPNDIFGGVVQYDLGKKHHEENFNALDV